MAHVSNAFTLRFVRASHFAGASTSSPSPRDAFASPVSSSWAQANQQPSNCICVISSSSSMISMHMHTQPCIANLNTSYCRPARIQVTQNSLCSPVHPFQSHVQQAYSLHAFKVHQSARMLDPERSQQMRIQSRSQARKMQMRSKLIIQQLALLADRVGRLLRMRRALDLILGKNEIQSGGWLRCMKMK